MIRKIALLLLAVMVLVLLVFLTGKVYIERAMTRHVHLSEAVVVNIPKGASLNTIVNLLAEQGLLQNPFVFTTYARLSENSQNIKAGEFRFEGEVSPLVMLERLVSGDVVSYSVTLVEGHDYRTLLKHIGVQPGLRPTLHGNSESEILSMLGSEQTHLEGLLFPDTYQYIAGERDFDVVSRAYQKMMKVISEEWGQRVADLPYSNWYEALIMASIVEKETGIASERADIAGVFVRRLKSKMRLQTDPTVIYGLGDEYKGNLTREHLKSASPYNTYMIDGLPPTPISMPGREAIFAALHPNSGATLYFVARGDGTHEFTENLEDHNKAVTTYQKQRINNYHSSPTPSN